MYCRCDAFCSAPKSTWRIEKKPTRSSKRRGIIGSSGRRTRLQWASTLTAGVGRPPGPAGPPPPRLAPFPDGLPVCVASTSTLSGKAAVRSMNDRFSSMLPRMASNCWTPVV